MKILIKLLNVIMRFSSTAGSQLSSNMHFWRYEPDKRHISITNNCRKQIKDLSLSESYAFDVYHNGVKTANNNRIVKK